MVYIFPDVDINRPSSTVEILGSFPAQGLNGLTIDPMRKVLFAKTMHPKRPVMKFTFEGRDIAGYNVVLENIYNSIRRHPL